MDQTAVRAPITGRVLTDARGAARLVYSLGASGEDFEFAEEDGGLATFVIARTPRGIKTLRTMFDTRRARPVEDLARATTQRAMARVLPPGFARRAAGA